MVRFRRVTSGVFSINESAAIGWPDANPVLFAAGPQDRSVVRIHFERLAGRNLLAYTPGQI